MAQRVVGRSAYHCKPCGGRNVTPDLIVASRVGPVLHWHFREKTISWKLRKFKNSLRAPSQLNRLIPQPECPSHAVAPFHNTAVDPKIFRGMTLLKYIPS